MRVMCFYDLPTITSKDRKNYRLFRKFLVNEGFIMMQESVYSKLVLNPQMAKLCIERIKKKLPPDGLVQVMTVTEKQYSEIECLLGDMSFNTNVLNTAERVVVF